MNKNHSDQIHDHDRGLVHDLQALVQLTDRRQALRYLVFASLLRDMVASDGTPQKSPTGTGRVADGYDDTSQVGISTISR